MRFAQFLYLTFSDALMMVFLRWQSCSENVSTQTQTRKALEHEFYHKPVLVLKNMCPYVVFIVPLGLKSMGLEVSSSSMFTWWLKMGEFSPVVQFWLLDDRAG